jgi:hypothetical protein
VNIYLSSRFARREELREYADILKGYGHEVTSSWVYREEQEDDNTSFCDRATWAEADVLDINKSYLCVFFTDDVATTSGGTYVEFGYAMGRRETRCIIVGPLTNIFHYMDDITQFDGWEAFLDWLCWVRL